MPHEEQQYLDLIRRVLDTPHCSSSAVLPSPQRDPVDDKLRRRVAPMPDADSVSSMSARLYRRAVDDRDARAAAKRSARNWAIDTHVVVEPTKPNPTRRRQSQRRQRQIRTEYKHSTHTSSSIVQIPPLSTMSAPNGPTVYPDPDSTTALWTTPTLNWMVTLVVPAEPHLTPAPTKPVDDVNASAKPATFSERTDEPNNAQQRELEALRSRRDRSLQPATPARPKSIATTDHSFSPSRPDSYNQPTNHTRPTRVYPDDRRNDKALDVKYSSCTISTSRRYSCNQSRPPDPSLISMTDVSANGKPAKLSKHNEEPIRRRPSRLAGILEPSRIQQDEATRAAEPAPFSAQTPRAPSWTRRLREQNGSGPERVEHWIGFASSTRKRNGCVWDENPRSGVECGRGGTRRETGGLVFAGFQEAGGVG
ncbi:hypothetical protein HMN09_00398200 [Mycena chlorophos]|uniref:Uncharacterized protein n=1 Tax=Mycena chlorophos TaxID=658473 RepID=A0A8H6TD73_MYCCL|nr:hypothetical protein HMN09_00398200 [Mycena chlorophos]